MLEPSEREVAVFSAARRLPVAGRLGYLDEACAGDDALRQRVEELLRASEEAGGFLQDPAPGAQRPADALASPNPRQNISTAGEKVGDRVGRYKLLQQIGEGGCGVVYMAEQEEPVRRRVALKVIKLGMDTKQVIARFEAERQALALMDHPNIAKVLEAGATDTGRPYFVMELVRGIKITHYCDENNLSTEERLDLFIKVSQAVQHAHQKGIIHRDIKPSNILVADHDGVPVPKIIDFGIAKATTDQRLTDKTLFTAFEQFIGTPAYISPEQARMSGLDIDTRTDIYSLGVLLYELLTGKTPFEAHDLLAAGLDEMRRTISEKEPARPSTRLCTMLESELTTTAKHRHTDPPKLIHLLSGDLDWIVMKALEKDRTRRYETANGLAMDIERHLKNEPVVACPPSNFYRFRKLVRRNRLAFAATVAVATALMIGLAVSSALLLREREARRRAVIAEKKAQTEAGKSQQVAQFLKDMLQGVGPSVALGRDTKMLREILDKTAEHIGKDLTNQPEVEVELCLTLSASYHDLGLYEQIEGLARHSLQRARSSFGDENGSVADSLIWLGDALMHRAQIELGDMRAGDVEQAEKDRRARDGNLVEAEKCTRDGLAMTRKLLGNENLKVADAINQLASVLTTKYELAEAESLHREALAIYKKLLGNEHPTVARLLYELATLLSFQYDKQAEAEIMIGEALVMQRKLLGNDHPEIAKSLFRLAIVLRLQGKRAEAETKFREVLAMWRKLRANDRIEVADSLSQLAQMLTPQGEKLAEAETLVREALAMKRRLFENEHPEVAISLSSLAFILMQQGNLTDAETLYREALAIQRKLFGNEHAEVAGSLYRLADVLQQQGRLAEAETALRETLATQRKLLGNEDPTVAWWLGNLVGVLMRERKFDEVENLFNELLTPAFETQPKSARLLHERGIWRARSGHWKEAAADFSREVAFGPENDEARHALAPLLVQSGDLPGYRLHCAQELARFAGATYPNTAERMAKDCLILPDSGVDLSAVSAWADTAVTAGKDSGDLPWFQFCKGLAEYRQGHFAGALDWLQKALSHAGDNLNRDVEAYMVLAMAQHCSKQANEASAALAKGVEIAEGKLPKLDSGDLGDGWLDWIIAHTLMREAKALIERPTLTPK